MKFPKWMSSFDKEIRTPNPEPEEGDLAAIRASLNASPDYTETVKQLQKEESKPKNKKKKVHHIPGGPVQDSEYVLNLDGWDKEAGADLVKSKHFEGIACTEETASDFHGCVFLPEIEIKEDTAEENRKQYIQTLMETPDFKAMRTATVLDKTASDIAAVSLVKGWQEHLKEQNVKEDIPEGEAGANDPNDAIFAAHKSVQEAKEELQLYDDTCNMFNISNGKGAGVNDPQKIDPARLTQLFTYIQKSQMLRDFMQKAGRYLNSARSFQKTKVKHGSDEVSGVEMGADFERMLPNELIEFAMPDMQVNALRKYVERQSMLRQMRTRESKAKGPIVVCVDESGSMSGERIQHAKALALGMWWIATHQNRGCWLIGFSGDGDPGCAYVHDKNRKNLGFSPSDLMIWVQHFYSGGTSYRIALEEVPSSWGAMQPSLGKGKADLIFITDGLSEVGRYKDNFMKWKAGSDVRLHTILIQDKMPYHEKNRYGGQFSELESISDNFFAISELSETEAAVESVFSIN